MDIRKKLAGLAVAAASVVIPASAQAKLIAQESFNYAPGALGPNNGGTGWTGGWYGATGVNMVTAGGFSWAGMTTSGNKARTGGNDQNEWRKLPATYGGPNGGTIWVSFIGKGDTTAPPEYPTSYAGLSLFSGPNSEPLFMGKPTLHDNWGWDDDRNKTPVQTNIPFTEEHLFVYRIDFGATAEQVRMFVDPAPNVIPLNSTAVLTSTNWAPFSFDRIRIASGCDPDPQVSIDEIKIGTTFTDVGPLVVSAVPEPGSLSIISLGVVLLRRRRRDGSGGE